MGREFLAQIEPLRLTASPHGKPTRRGKRSWLSLGLIAAAILILTGQVFGLPKLSSFGSSALICLLVAWMAYVALAGKLGDEATRW
jgi:hypothetical protein